MKQELTGLDPDEPLPESDRWEPDAYGRSLHRVAMLIKQFQ